ncbi:MAG: PTS sugar transporter subunit IIA [Pseudomonadota bacterium]
MDIESILTPERTRCGLAAASKKRAIEEAATLIATAAGLNANEIYDRLIAREKLGTTAIGEGIAIPHCRIEGCTEIIGGLFRLDSAVDFDAFDNQPVQLLFVLLVPGEEVDEHLQALGMLARRFESSEYRESLLSASGDRDLFERAVHTASFRDSA